MISTGIPYLCSQFIFVMLEITLSARGSIYSNSYSYHRNKIMTLLLRINVVIYFLLLTLADAFASEKDC
jgi:hypothetical protein